MKLLRRTLLLTSLLALSPIDVGRAADAKKDPAPADAKPATAAAKDAPKTPEQEAAEKAARAEAAQERKKVHVLALMDVKFSRGTGQVMFEIFPGDAPKTVENFRENAKKGVYNGLAFHRAIKDFLVQTGDIASKDNKARETWGLTQGYTIPAEIKRAHAVGAVAMARRGDKVNPDRRSDGTQFYFTLGNMSTLDGQYTVFGQVVSGLDVLRRISHATTDANDCPVERIEIKKLQVVEQQGPLVTINSTGPGNSRHVTKPDALKGPIERFLERIW
jgi:cyclophilin family peptidyl-prolyl cis-trans isomerase